MPDRLVDIPALLRHITTVLHERNHEQRLYPGGVSGSAASSAVMFLLGRQCGGGRPASEPCVILNKRSQKMKQPGDLCFPGGRIAPRLDPVLAKVLTLPLFPLYHWAKWPVWRDKRPRQAGRLTLLLATGLREGLEEMRLNPMGVEFLGPLPSQELVMFRRVIYPMAGWVKRQRHFFPNWEVEKIVHVPLRSLLDPGSYACYRLHFDTAGKGENGKPNDYPCFVYQDQGEREVLWGATYRIVMVFLDLVFGFRPPDMRGLPVVSGSLGADYYNGAG